MSQRAETGRATGTADKNYNLTWFPEPSLSNALRLETYIADADRATRSSPTSSLGTDREP